MAKRSNKVPSKISKEAARRASPGNRQRQGELFKPTAGEQADSPSAMRGPPSKVERYYYEPEDLEDAAGEAFSSGAAYGILTWSTWDTGVRPLEERVKDFVAAFPPADPLRYALGGMKLLGRQAWKSKTVAEELDNFFEVKGGVAQFDRQLARFGLKRKGAAPMNVDTFSPKAQLQATRERNQALRVLHGSVDVEAADMNAAKETFLEQMEKRRAATEIRAARLRIKLDKSKSR